MTPTTLRTTQDCSNSIANTLELLLSYTKPLNMVVPPVPADWVLWPAPPSSHHQHPVADPALLGSCQAHSARPPVGWVEVAGRWLLQQAHPTAETRAAPGKKWWEHCWRLNMGVDEWGPNRLQHYQWCTWVLSLVQFHATTGYKSISSAKPWYQVRCSASPSGENQDSLTQYCWHSWYHQTHHHFKLGIRVKLDLAYSRQSLLWGGWGRGLVTLVIVIITATTTSATWWRRKQDWSAGLITTHKIKLFHQKYIEAHEAWLQWQMSTSLMVPDRKNHNSILREIVFDALIKGLIS